jgi:uncharacterized protein
MRKVNQFLFAIVVFLFVAGCASGRRERELLSRHPLTENRMSAVSTNGYEPSGVWKIRGASNTVYLAGTSHLVAADQVPFPSPFYAAYQDSRDIYVEYNTHSLFSQIRILPKAWGWVNAHRSEFICPKGKTIADYVAPDTLEKLKAHYGKKFRKRETEMPLLLLFLNEFEAEGDSVPDGGVEDIFMIAAKRDGKPLRALDDKNVIDTAMLALDEMVAGFKADIARRGVDAVIEDKIIHRKAEDPQDDLWRKGDLPGIEKFQSEMKKESEMFFDKGLVERNQKWMPKIEAALHGKHNAMILVGCGHLAGDIGLLKLLRDAGYDPQQLYGLDRPPVSAQPRR